MANNTNHSGKTTTISLIKRIGMASMVAVLLATTALPASVYAHDGHDGEVAATGQALVDDDASWLDLLLEEFLLGSAEATATVSVSSNGTVRTITADGIPTHSTGAFPNNNNPNAITAQSYQFTVDATPSANGSTSASDGYIFGVALSGAVFDPGTAEYWNRDRSSGWRYEAISVNGPDLGLDYSNAHVQPNGAYHYHGIPEALIDALETSGTPTLIGYAADGFPIYGPLSYADADDPNSGLVEMDSSYVLQSGTRDSGPGGTYDGTFTQDWTYAAGTGDLDACNGRYGVTEEYPGGTYYYVITDEFPFIPRCFVGTPDDSFQFQNARSNGVQARRAPAGPRGERVGQRPPRPGLHDGPGFRRPPPPRG